MPCDDLLIIHPTVSEVKVLTEMTKRHMLSNNKVIDAVCPQINRVMP